LAGRDEVRDGRFESSGPGSAEEEDGVLRPADFAQAREDALVHRQEVGAAVVEHGRADRCEHFGRHRRRSRREEVALRRHARTVAFYSAGVDALVAFAAALLSLRLAGLLAGRYRSGGRPEMLAWATGLGAYAVAAAAIAWGEAAGWDARTFRVYYAAGALLTAPLLGAGSLLLAGHRRAPSVALVYAGLAVGVPLPMPVDRPFAA